MSFAERDGKILNLISSLGENPKPLVLQKTQVLSLSVFHNYQICVFQ